MCGKKSVENMFLKGSEDPSWQRTILTRITTPPTGPRLAPGFCSTHWSASCFPSARHSSGTGTVQTASDSHHGRSVPAAAGRVYGQLSARHGRTDGRTTEEASDPDPALAPEPRGGRFIHNRHRATKERWLLPGSKMTFSPRPVERHPSPSQEQIISMRRPGCCCGRPSGMCRGDAPSTFQRLVRRAHKNVRIVSDWDSAKIRASWQSPCSVY